MRQSEPTTISAAQLRRRLAAGHPLWLVYAPDAAAFAAGHIPGSLAADGCLPSSVFAGMPVVVYGEDAAAERPRALARALVGDGVDACWYAGGLRDWAAAGLPVDRSPVSGRAFGPALQRPALQPPARPGSARPCS